MSPKVLITARHFDVDGGARARLLGEGIVPVPSRFGGDEPDSGATSEELVDLVHDADGVIRGLAPLTADVLSACERLRVISVRGVGTDGIDLDYARSRDIRVTITPGAIDRAVAECAFALMFGLARGVAAQDREVREGRWKPRMGTEPSQKTLGVIGLGRIGGAVARCGRALGMRVLAYSRRSDPARAAACGAEQCDLTTLLSQSDFVSLHCALTKETEGLIGAEELASMKAGALLINTARGAIVDEGALYDALKEERLGGAGLDVFREEPPPTTHPLLTLPNVLVMAHAGGYTTEGLMRANDQAAENVIRILTGVTLPADTVVC